MVAVKRSPPFSSPVCNGALAHRTGRLVGGFGIAGLEIPPPVVVARAGIGPPLPAALPARLALAAIFHGKHGLRRLSRGIAMKEKQYSRINHVMVALRAPGSRGMILI